MNILLRFQTTSQLDREYLQCCKLWLFPYVRK